MMGCNKVEEATVERSPNVYSTSGAKRRENTPPESLLLKALSAYAELASPPDPVLTPMHPCTEFVGKHCEKSKA